MTRALALLALCGVPLAAQTRLLVTATEQRSGKPVTALKAEDFIVTDDKTPRQVRSAEFRSSPIDVMLLVDTSLVGGIVQPLALDLIDQLHEKEQMALVSFADTADLVQDFTPSKPSLKQALSRVRYGNQPRLLDALYAAIDGGFEHALYRRVILLLTAGLDGGGRTPERDVLRLARRNGVSIYPVFVSGVERGMFETLARHTGGASFRLSEMSKELGKDSRQQLAPRIFEVLRAHYLLVIAGNALPGDKLKIETRSPQRLLVSALPVE